MGKGNEVRSFKGINTKGNIVVHVYVFVRCVKGMEDIFNFTFQ